MERLTAADGTTLALERHGEQVPGRPPVVLVTPGGADRTDLADLAQALAPAGLTVTYDRRGRGDSGDNAVTVEGAVDRELADLRVVIEAVGKPVVLLGHSSGAILSVVAAAAGLPVAGLVLFEPPFLPRPGARRVAPDLPGRIWDLATQGRADDAVALFQTEAVGLPEELVTQVRQAPFWPHLAGMARSLAYDVAVTARHAEPAELAGTVAVPTVVLAGRDTWPDLAEAARRAAEVLGAQHRTVEGANHALVPEAVAPLVADLVARAAAGAQEPR